MLGQCSNGDTVTLVGTVKSAVALVVGDKRADGYCLSVKVGVGRADSGIVRASTLEVALSLAPAQRHLVGRLDGSVSSTRYRHVAAGVPLVVALE